MGYRTTTLRVSAWFDERDMEVTFPENWEVEECRMGGHDRPAISDDQIRQAIQSPIGSPRLSELARGKKEVCIIFDDLPKPTPAWRLAPFVIEELHAGGIKDEQIRFVCGPGSHRPLVYREFEAKLGPEIVSRYPVYNHNAFENHVLMGTTRRGTPVWLNKEVAYCDLRVAIGGFFPHGSAGFGGGGKIILPGVVGIQTIEHHHKNMKEGSGLGKIEGNVFREDLDEAARIAGLDFKVDCVNNNRREVVAVFAGDHIAEHRAGVPTAREVYGTKTAAPGDILISNSFPDEMQAGRAFWPVQYSLREGGDMVVVCHSHEGQNLHQFSGRFGTQHGGRGYSGLPRAGALQKAGRVLFLAPFLSMYDRVSFGLGDKLVWCKDWSEVLASLADKNGPGSRVVIYPYAPMQLPI